MENKSDEVRLALVERGYAELHESIAILDKKLDAVLQSVNDSKIEMLREISPLRERQGKLEVKASLFGAVAGLLVPLLVTAWRSFAGK